MKVQVASDLHLEFRSHDYKSVLKPSADILILAGDICPLATTADRNVFIAFIAFYASRFQQIIHVPGNHEYYGSSRLDATMQDIHKFATQLQRLFPNYSFLNNKVLTVQSRGKVVHFVGTTLWTRISPENMRQIQDGMNDYSHINVMHQKKNKQLTPEIVNQIHRESAAFIRRQLKALSGSVVLITHHKPFLGVTGKGKFSEAYEVDLSDVLRPPVVLSVHGHTHQKFRGAVNGVLTVSNPRGYPYERTDFNPAFVVQI